MPRFKDISGQTFGRLTALNINKEITKLHQHGTYWDCICECGSKVTVYLGNLTSGKQKSCGCLQSDNRHKKKIDMIGKQFNFLTVLYELPERKNNRIIYHCKCECGNECNVDGISLRNNHVISCGCAHWQKYNIVGQKFNKLTVLEHIYIKNPDNNAMYKCQCECGKIIFTSAKNLKMNLTTSCGCTSISAGEHSIIQLLNEHNVSFLYDTPYFKDLYGDTNSLLRYDFIIFNNKNEPIRLIEFDGRQHFESIIAWGGKEQLLKQQKYDKIKNEYAKKHNIPLIRIPYTEIKNITYNMLISDQFLIA